MASAIKNATRLLKSYLKNVEGNAPSNEALKVRGRPELHQQERVSAS